MTLYKGEGCRSVCTVTCGTSTYNNDIKKVTEVMMFKCYCVLFVCSSIIDKGFGVPSEDLLLHNVKDSNILTEFQEFLRNLQTKVLDDDTNNKKDDQNYFVPKKSLLYNPKDKKYGVKAESSNPLTKNDSLELNNKSSYSEISEIDKTVYNLLKAVEDVNSINLKSKNIGEHQLKNQYYAIKQKSDELLQNLHASHIIDSKSFISFTEDIRKFLNNSKNNKKFLDKTSFCKSGQDCFADVDHQTIATEIKHLAIIMAQHVKNRLSEGNNINRIINNGFDPRNDQSNEMLREITSLIAKLHRAILRNWHHILMMAGNLSGQNVNNIPINDEYNNMFQKRNREFSQLKDTILEFQCTVTLNENPSHIPNDKDCQDELLWHQNTKCKSLITAPNSQCIPHRRNGGMTEIRNGSLAFKIEQPGRWKFHFNAEILPRNHIGILRDTLLGRIDRISKFNPNQIQKLNLINHSVVFHHLNGTKGLTTHIESGGSGLFEIGDSLVFRLGVPKEKVNIVFGAYFTNDEV